MGKSKRVRAMRTRPGMKLVSKTRPNVDTHLIRKSVSKKEKIKEKHEALIEKLTRSKTVIESKKSGEALSLIELLDAVALEEKNIVASDARKKELNQRASKKPIGPGQRSKILASSKKGFDLVVSHPQFQQNALATIREHMRNKIKMESS